MALAKILHQRSPKSNFYAFRSLSNQHRINKIGYNAFKVTIKLQKFTSANLNSLNPNLYSRSRMDTIDLEKLIQQGYYVTLGATSSLLEVIQDPIKREENLRMWGRTFNELSQDLAAKGVSTEAEARSYVDSFIAQRVNGTKPQEETTSLTTVNTTAESVEETNAEASSAKVKSSMRDEIQELTDQLTNLRAELEQLRQK